MLLNLKVIRTRQVGVGRNRKLRRSETTISMPLNDSTPVSVLRAIWEFEHAINAHSEVRLHAEVVKTSEEQEDL